MTDAATEEVKNVPLFLRGGRVLDPRSGLDAVRNILVVGDRIVAIGSDLTPPNGATVVDVAGKIVTPGWIDIHAHTYWGVTTWGIFPDPICLSTGVTTIVDAGSPGWATFAGFREWIVQPAHTRVLTFVHISGIGLSYCLVGEMEDLRYAHVDYTERTIRDHPGIAVGVKVRQGLAQVGSHGVEPLRRAIDAAKASDTRVMVHIAAGVPLPDVVCLLRPGDIVTHCYQGRGDTIFDETGELLSEVREARNRGVLFDVGHGSGSFHYPTGHRAIEAGFLPDVISSDLHSISVEGPAYDLPTTASKFLNLGMNLWDVIEAVTFGAARAIGWDEEIGHLSEGGFADIAVFELKEGAFPFVDTHNIRQTGRRRFVPVATIRGGVLWRPDEVRAQFGRPGDEIPPLVREANDELLRLAGIERAQLRS